MTTPQNPDGFGQDPFNKSDSGQPQYGQPQYGQPQYGQPQYGQPQYGQNPYQGGAPGMEPDNNLVWAILSTVLCCLPLGIVSIVKSTSVGKLWAMGDYAGAQQAADDAKKFAMWSAIAAVAWWVIFVIFYAVVIAAAVSNTA
ncbi:CD225/dispanin family protein [Gordonia sp. HY285]|uniref:CD225/dispanin family protein n=1 Tax=Gordonia liuliyuniae TaxID=2911517 RepID=UPI001EFFB065|nr:CD225/dispanin family protein [Gordonia liuliyuniae]MCF8609644.1 CD225/dispanin family protein [Gordonia liuliyuniae]